MNGKLYLVATPIGNMRDITLRAIDIMKEVDVIACEDTRKTGILLKEYGIDKKLETYHDHNKMAKGKHLINLLKGGTDIALVSDAGTPGVNDPGFNLCRDAIAEGIEVFSIPGAAAFLTALITSGLPTDRFCYEGFLPVKKGRQTALDKIKDEERTIILYESVHRILRTLEDILVKVGDRNMTLHREMTKIHEEVYRGKVSEVIEQLKNSVVKGEFCIVLEGRGKKNKKDKKYEINDN